MSKLEYRLSNVVYNSNENPLDDERTLVVIVNPELYYQMITCSLCGRNILSPSLMPNASMNG